MENNCGLSCTQLNIIWCQKAEPVAEQHHKQKQHSASKKKKKKKDENSKSNRGQWRRSYVLLPGPQTDIFTTAHAHLLFCWTENLVCVCKLQFTQIQLYSLQLQYNTCKRQLTAHCEGGQVEQGTHELTEAWYSDNLCPVIPPVHTELQPLADWSISRQKISDYWLLR